LARAAVTRSRAVFHRAASRRQWRPQLGQDPIAMKSKIAEWLWRFAVLLALGWIGLQLQRLHEDVIAPVDDAANVASSDETQGALDSIHDDLDALTKKVDAILVVMARTR
jgi:hypothetical protein